MSKSWLLFLASIAACGMASASTLYVSASGRFSSSDIADPLVSPNGQFTLRFAVDSNPTPLTGSVTSLGFDLPVTAFSYVLNGGAVNATPTEIRFNTLANGGLFDISFGSGLSASEFSFEGVQAFSGSTAAPVFSIGSFGISTWTYSDPANFDSQAPTASAAAITPTPEPSSIFLMLGGLVALLGLGARKSRRVVAAMLTLGASVWAEVPVTQVMNIPNTGQQITPLAPRGSRFTYLNPGLSAYPNHFVGQAVTTVSSPDHKTLLMLTTGDYGIYTATGARDTAASTDWVFVFDITTPVPVQKQAIQIPNTYNGIVFDPSGTIFYVAGGRNDNVHIFTLTGGVWGE
jgi:hypothetical protein